MANQQQLRILERGPEVWNNWRRKNKEIIDLSEVDLRHIKGDGVWLSDAILNNSNLSGVNLFRANLKGAKLSKATLSGTILREAVLEKTDLYNSNLRDANLSNTNLKETNLRKTDLSRANLSSADLSYADLSFANLTSADLKGADLNCAVVGYTNFGNINLGRVKNLELVYHKYRSIIDPMTLTKSGQLPKSFLRGCGLEENFINQISSLFLTTVSDGYCSCFISYSHHDKDFAVPLHDNLQSRGIRCWLDDRDIILGRDIHEELRDGILGADKVLLCCSKNSLKSGWVDHEIIIALKKEESFFGEHGRKKLVLIPLNLDDYMFDHDWQSGKKDQLQSRRAANFVGWRKDKRKFMDEVEKLTKALKKV